MLIAIEMDIGSSDVAFGAVLGLMLTLDSSHDWVVIGGLSNEGHGASLTCCATFTKLHVLVFRLFVQADQSLHCQSWLQT